MRAQAKQKKALERAEITQLSNKNGIFYKSKIALERAEIEYSGVAEPGIPPNRATLIPVAKARVSTTESHMKRGNFEHMCG